jgi:hypothetical protein
MSLEGVCSLRTEEPKSPNWETPYCTKLIFSAESFFGMVCFFLKTFFF